MKRLLVAAAALGLAACATRLPDGADGALLDLWTALPMGQASLAQTDIPAYCDASFGTWFTDFGVRGMACATDAALPLETAIRRAPGSLWVSGPHQITDDGLQLDLNADTFGHYNADVVAWIARAAIPRTDAARAVAQPAYDRYVRRTARVYWTTYGTLALDGLPATVPPGPASDYMAYLDGGQPPADAVYNGGISMESLFGEQSLAAIKPLVEPGDNVWLTRYEANTAFGFWLRRRADGTQATFHTGLRDLLEAFDADWLASVGG